MLSVHKEIMIYIVYVSDPVGHKGKSLEQSMQCTCSDPGPA